MKILIIAIGRIGDMALTTALFNAVKSKYPSAQIDVIASKSNYPIPANHKFVNKTFIYNKSPLDILKIALSIRKEVYDYYIDAKDHYSSESRLFAKIAKAKVKIGFNPSDKKRIFDKDIDSDEANKGLHFVARLAKTALHLGIDDVSTFKPIVCESKDSKLFVENFLKENLLDSFYCVNISAYSDSRMMPAEKWINLIKSFKARAVIVGVPEHIEQALKIQSAYDGSALLQTRNVMDLASLIAHAKAVISPDTSAVHFASAFNAPIFALFGKDYTAFTKFAPLSDIKAIIQPTKGDLIIDIENDSLLSAFSDFENRINESLA